MTYIARTPDKYEGRFVGESHQCVAFVKAVANAPYTGSWKKGAAVIGNAAIETGTAIACGWDDHGNYPSNAHGNHAAIYIAQHGDYIEVWDQWVGHPVARRTKIHHNERPYHVIE